MLVIVGLLVLLAAALVAVVGVLGNSGAAQPLTGTLPVFGYHTAGSTRIAIQNHLHQPININTEETP
jgi:hypothetical protein